MFYAVLAGGAIATISEVIGDLQKAAGASERIVELLHTQPDIPASSAMQADSLPTTDVFHKPTDPSLLALEVSNINFSYPSVPDKQIIHDLSFTVNSGEKVAIVGHSGAGKSTLFDLFMRFYDIDSGEIFIQGQALNSLDTGLIRQHYALVPQDAVIFATTVLENIRLSKPTASEEDVIAAAKLAYAHEFIEGFINGYHTELGERGVKLSGGQKQRIAIARAILAKRPILLLDEATSALDASSEKYVKQALDSLMNQTTTLIIAHRLSTVINADNIIVLEQGRMLAQGKHQDLLTQSPVYKEFVELQLS